MSMPDLKGTRKVGVDKAPLLVGRGPGRDQADPRRPQIPMLWRRIPRPLRDRGRGQAGPRFHQLPGPGPPVHQWDGFDIDSYVGQG